MNEQTRKLIAEIQEYKGKNFALFCAVEEMAELSKELLKNINRGKDNYDEIIEETADVMVCLEYIKLAYKISDDKLNEILNEKMPRKWIPRIEKWKTNK